MKMPNRMLVMALAVLFTSLPLIAGAAAFTIVTSGFADNALLPADMGFDKNDAGGHSCGGVNKAPGWTWSNAPEKTASFAILMVDPGGQAGAGVNHWVE